MAEESIAPNATMEDPPGSDGKRRVNGRVKERLPHQREGAPKVRGRGLTMKRPSLVTREARRAGAKVQPWGWSVDGKGVILQVICTITELIRG